MKILIAGSGDTGTHLAKMLSYESQDVVLLSDDKAHLENLDSRYNLMVSIGSPLNVGDLRTAGVADADLFIAVTPHETDNIVACEMAHSLGAARCVARIGNPEFMRGEMVRMFADAGVDSLILPEQLACREICDLIRRSWAVNWFRLYHGRLILAGIRITDATPVRDTPLKNVHLDGRRLHVVAIRRNGRLIIPRGDDSLLKGDLAYITIRPEDEGYLREAMGAGKVKISSVMVSGGGKISRLLCKALERKCHVTVIEKDRDRCRQLAEEFPDVTVVNTGCRDFTTLRDEGVENTDIFIALSDSDEANIVACMVARKAGVKRTVAEIEDVRYIADAEQLWIDKVVNKKLLTSGHVLRDILGNDVRVSEIMTLEDLEIAEIEAGEGSNITARPVKDLRLPDTLTLGGLIRHGEGMLIAGDTRIEPGDMVMVVFQPGNLHKVRRLFR